MQKVIRNGTLLAECWLELARASALVRLFPSRMAISPSPCATAVSDVDDALRTAEKLCMWVDRAASRHVKHMTCLERAVAAQRVLARRGLRTELQIGVRREAEAWEAHAWLSLGGVSLDRQPEAFVVMTATPNAF